MLCPKCGSDYINYSMKKNEQGIMCMHAECQSCHYFWTYCQEISKEYFKREDIGTPKKRIEKEKICRPERKPKFNNPKKNDYGDIPTKPNIPIINQKSNTNKIAKYIAIAASVIVFLVLMSIYFPIGWLLLLLAAIVVFAVWVNYDSNKKETYSPEYNVNMTGNEYEQFVAGKLRREGYHEVIVTSKSNDHGADILAIAPDGKRVVIQCKHYKRTVGQRAVQDAVSARNYYHYDRSMVITNSKYTKQARNFAYHTDTVLIEKYR